jgi:hypothetical protein
VNLLPDPVPLDPPAGSPDAVDDAARATSAAARLLDEFTDRLAGARTPVAWHGADAGAAAALRRRIARLGGDGAEELHRTAVRLAAHAEVLREVHARLRVLQAAQDEEFAVAGSRVAVPLDPNDPLAPHPADVLARLRAAEAGRAAEHARLTARVDDDAAATIRVLSAAASLVAGTPRYDDAAALLRLADLLPAWGTRQLAHRGHVLAVAVRRGRLDSAELQAAAAADLDLATDPAYAAAFLAGLRPQLVIAWLSTAWDGAAADDPRADLLARVLSALDRASSGPPWLAGLLDRARGTGELPMVAGGLGAVLARAKATGLAGPPPTLAAAWSRSLVREQRATGAPIDVGVPPAGADPAASDPMALLAAAMVEQRAALEVAELMSDHDSWAVVLSRGWDDPALRDALVATVADAPPEVASQALRDGLVALGTGLADGDPDDWPFVEERIAQVAPVLTTALLRHPDVLVRPLAGVAAGTADPVSVTALRGLAVTMALDAGTDAGARGRVGERIARALSHPHPGVVPGDGAAPGVVPAALVAVREHGADLAHAMEQHRRRDEAEAQAHLWDATFGIGFTVAGAVPRWGMVATTLEVLVTDALGTDGSFTNTPDRQQHHPDAEATAAAVCAAEHRGEDRDVAARQGLSAYERTLRELGTPIAPVAPPDRLVEKLVQGVVDDTVGGLVGRGLGGVTEDLRGTVGGLVVDAAEGLLTGSD